MAQIKTMRTQIAARIEAAEGTMETLAGADALLAGNLTYRIDTDMTPRPNVTGSLSQFSRVPGRRSATMEFEAELKGSGAAGTAPAIGRLLRACGFGETVVPSTSVTYAPASTAVPTITLGAFQDGATVFRAWGARGNVRLVFRAGQHPVAQFRFLAADFSHVDGALLTTGVVYETTIPQAFLSATLTVQGYAAIVESVEIDTGNEVVPRIDANAPSGQRVFIVANRDPIMTFDPELVTVATADFYGQLRSGTIGALNIGPLGATAGNRVTVAAPRVQYTGITPGDRQGIRSLGIDCALTRNAGDDELTIAFT